MRKCFGKNNEEVSWQEIRKKNVFFHQTLLFFRCYQFPAECRWKLQEKQTALQDPCCPRQAFPLSSYLFVIGGPIVLSYWAVNNGHLEWQPTWDTLADPQEEKGGVPLDVWVPSAAEDHPYFLLPGGTWKSNNLQKRISWVESWI